MLTVYLNFILGILNAIKLRRLDTLFEYEEKILAGGTLDKPLMEILSDAETGTPEDKMRLILIYYICTDSVPEVKSKVCFFLR